MANSVKKNTLFLSIGQFIQTALSFILMPVATRYLGDDGFGQYNLATAIMYIIFLVNDFGLNTLTTRENARDRDQAAGLFANALFVKIVFVILCAIALGISLWIYDFPRRTAVAVSIFAIYGVFSSVAQLATGVFRSFERMEYEAVVVILEKLVITGLGVYALVRGASLVAFAAVFAVGGLASLVLGLFIVNKKFFPVRLQVDVGRAQALLKQSMIFGLSMFLVTIYDRVAVLMLGKMQTDEVVGWYSAAYKLIALTSIVPMIIANATFPKLSRESQMGEAAVAALFTKGFKYLVFLALPLIAGASILAAPIINLVCGPGYEEAVPALRILVLTSALSFLNIFLAGLFWATNHQKRMFIFQAVALAMNIALNLVLIPDYGHIGAAWSSVATEGVIFLLSFYVAVTKITRIAEGLFVLKGLGATAVMTAFLLIAPPIHLLASIFFSMVVYFASLILLRGFALDEILSFRQ
jgi:O-antigen/teichoic acid export membrane protein